jgi:hypothetical protein
MVACAIVAITKGYTPLRALGMEVTGQRKTPIKGATGKKMEISRKLPEVAVKLRMKRVMPHGT